MPLDPTIVRPTVDGQDFLDAHRTIRKQAAAVSVAQPAPVIPSNGEELAFHQNPVSNFTKGLPHDRYGRVDPEAYRRFVKALRAPAPLSSSGGLPVPLGPRDQVDSHLPQMPTPYMPWASGAVQPFDQVHRYHFSTIDGTGQASEPSVRRWESPQGGHNYDLMGPAAAGVAIPPAPKLGSDELVAEMAELYAMALLRDVPFTALERAETAVRVDNGPTFTLGDLVEQLNALPWFDRDAAPTSGQIKGAPLDGCERRRRESRYGGCVRPLAPRDLFRGSTHGSRVGPYISQFMLVGAAGRGEGRVAFGAQDIDQRCRTRVPGIDYMTAWPEWLDVQNGARHRGVPVDGPQRFITTPRDLASYVEIDQLYQAYFNAALILLERRLPFDPGLPDTGRPTREGFAVWGAPHLLSLFAEVASRGLKAVRRTKFQIHRRARPEVIAARLAIATGADAAVGLGAARDHVNRMLGELYGKAPDLMHWIERLNARQNLRDSMERGLVPAGNPPAHPDIKRNILLPMAFPVGSPMHPAYGAGHATVAGACVTVLKAFFAMFEGSDGSSPPIRLDAIGLDRVKVGASEVLADYEGSIADLTVQGELDKLASNVSIGRNLAGVHYYTDYYESIRLGERVALGILREQMMTSPEPISMRFDDFDGRRVTLSFDPATESEPSLTIAGTGADAWWVENVACYIPSAGFARAAE